MNREKLNKAAREFAAMETEDYGDIDERTTAHNNCIYGFRRGVEWLQSQPLSERLTEEEKAKIIKMYKSDLTYARMYTKKMESATDPSSLQKATNEREIFVSGVRMLKTIFGSDLFNDKSE